MNFSRQAIKVFQTQKTQTKNIRWNQISGCGGGGGGGKKKGGEGVVNIDKIKRNGLFVNDILPILPLHSRSPYSNL